MENYSLQEYGALAMRVVQKSMSISKSCFVWV